MIVKLTIDGRWMVAGATCNHTFVSLSKYSTYILKRSVLADGRGKSLGYLAGTCYTRETQTTL